MRLKLGEQGRGKTDGTEEIGGDDGFGVGEIGLLGEELFSTHDSGVVDEDVEGGELGSCVGGEGADGGGVFDVEGEGLHAGVCGNGSVEDMLASAGDDDLVAEGEEGFCESAADSGAAAGDEDGVAGKVHGVVLQAS